MYDMQTKPKTNLSNDKKQETSKTVKPRRAIDFHKPAQSNSFQFVEHKKSQQNTYGSSIIQEKPNRTGLPDSLKNGIESLSGYSMDDVKVHYNSSDPAQLGSLAYARGNDIYVAPGQERHLGHEAWHIVQQKQGRVAPTMQMKSVDINNDAVLEREADIMGSKAIQMKAPANTVNLKHVKPVSCVQRKSGDLKCKAEICYKDGSNAIAEGYNKDDCEKVKEMFKYHGLVKLSNVKQKTNPPGICAEPHAVANALVKGGKRDGKIDQVTITKAEYTLLCKKRISDEITKNSIDDQDMDNINIMLKQLYPEKKITVENLYSGSVSTEDITKNIMEKPLTRKPCETCRQWIQMGQGETEGIVKSEYLSKGPMDTTVSATDTDKVLRIYNELTEELEPKKKELTDLIQNYKNKEENLRNIINDTLSSLLVWATSLVESLSDKKILLHDELIELQTWNDENKENKLSYIEQSINKETEFERTSIGEICAKIRDHNYDSSSLDFSFICNLDDRVNEIGQRYYRLEELIKELASTKETKETAKVYLDKIKFKIRQYNAKLYDYKKGGAASFYFNMRDEKNRQQGKK